MGGVRENTYGHFVPERHPRHCRLRIVVCVLIAIVGLLASLYLSRFFTIQQLQRNLSGLMQEETVALSAQAELRAQLALKNDPQTIEDMARELLGLVKPGEEKVIFIEGD